MEEKVQEKNQSDNIKIQSNPYYNYNKSGQTGRDPNPEIAQDHKNWGLLRCASPTKNY